MIEYLDRRIELLHDSEVLPFKVFDRAKPIITAVDDKTLNPRVDQVLEQRRQTPPRKPPTNHPWRNSYKQSLVMPVCA